MSRLQVSNSETSDSARVASATLSAAASATGTSSKREITVFRLQLSCHLRAARAEMLKASTGCSGFTTGCIGGSSFSISYFATTPGPIHGDVATFVYRMLPAFQTVHKPEGPTAPDKPIISLWSGENMQPLGCILVSPSLNMQPVGCILANRHGGNATKWLHISFEHRVNMQPQGCMFWEKEGRYATSRLHDFQAQS